MKKTSLLVKFFTAVFGFWSVAASAQICFNPAQNYNAGNWGPGAIITADFNGDGKLDLVTTNPNNAAIGIQLGVGNGSFPTATMIGLTPGADAWDIAAADFNGDGKLDVVTSNYTTNNLNILLGNGAGNFGVPTAIAMAAANPNSVATGDFNADGKADIAVVYENNSDVTILLGNGLGGFAAGVNYNVGYSENYDVAARDLNGDNKLDLVVANHDDGSVSVLIGNGNGTFQAGVAYSASCDPSQTAFGDFNSDGKLDLIVSGTCGNPYFLPGNGNGTFQSGSSVSGYGSYAVGSADLNGDGNMDVITSDMNGNEIAVALGNGAGSFSSASYFQVSDQPYYFVTGDFNGDGRTDIASAGYNSNQNSILINAPLPLVTANTSAATICPGTDVVLTGTGAGVGGVNTYLIPLSGLFSTPNSCGNGSYYGNNPGFNWNDNLAPGSVVSSITIQINVGVDCSGGNHTGYLNGNNQGSVNFGGSWCSCALRNNIITYNVNPADYNVGSGNSFYYSGSTAGYCPNSGWPSGTYAKVIVNWGATYSWNNGVTNGVPFAPANTNTYVVTGTTQNGCTNNASVVVTVLPAVTTTLSTTDPSCVCNGSADITAGGGTAPFSYLWSNGATTTAVTGLCAADYTVTVTDSKGCKGIETTTLNNNPSMSFSFSNNDATCLCNGTSSVTVTGGTGPYTYSWSNGATTSAATGLCAGNYTITATDATGCTNSDVVTINDNQTLSISLTKANATCTASCNGTATAVVSGGTGPYTYAWAPSGGTSSAAAGLCVGTYTLTATDANGCANKATITIGVTPMSVSFVNISANCSSSCTGSSTASIVGGTAPYTYSWSNGATTSTATGLCGGGNYTLTVTSAGGCTAVGVTNIASNPVVMVNGITSTAASCTTACNGSASVTNVTNGVAPYTYSWAPNGGSAMTATGLCVGNYTVTVRDANGCSTTATVSVSVTNNPMYIDDVDYSDASCANICNSVATAYALNGTGAYTYAWAPSGGSAMTATGLCGNDQNGVSYTVTVTDALGCSDQYSININLAAPMSINFNTMDATCDKSCDGVAMVTSITNGVAPFSYMWANGATTTSVSGLCVGTHSAIVTVTDSVGCKATDDLYIYDGGNGVDIDGFWSTNTFCNNVCTGTAIVDLDGTGTAPFTYLWNNGATTSSITGLCQGWYDVTVVDAKGCTDDNDVYINANSNLNISMYTNDANCYPLCDGSAYVGSISGGAGPYTYAWSNGATTAAVSNLCVGDYTVTVTDVNGCTDNDWETIYYDYGLNYNNYTWDASCNGVCNGKDSIYVWNGTAPYSYQWSNGATTAVVTGLCGNDNFGVTYTVTVTDSIGCKLVMSDEIYSDYPPSVNISKQDVYCSNVCNGKATVYAAGGTAPYAFLWSTGATTNSISGLCAGGYNVTVTDAKGCSSVNTFNINTINSNVSVNVTSVSPKCNGATNGSATAMVNGGTGPYNYAWAPSGGSAATANNLAAGSYTVTVTDINGCSATAVEVITQPAAMVANVTVTNPTSCVQGDGSATANVAGGTAPYTFNWSNGQITQTAVSLANGSYSVTVTDVNGCTATGSASVTCTSGISELSAANVFSVYPNPTQGQVVVTAITSAGIQAITIENVLGEVVLTTSVDKNQITKTVDITEQPAGVYMMRILSEGRSYTQKLIKE